jgi:hypothetical protein
VALVFHAYGNDHQNNKLHITMLIDLCPFVMSTARGVDMEADKPKFMMTKVKALKVLDGKSAQNICEYHITSLRPFG